jgi:hypothetical protein
MRKSATVSSDPSLDWRATSDPCLPEATLPMPRRIGVEALGQQPVRDGGAGWVRGRGDGIIGGFWSGVWSAGAVSEPPSSVLPIPSSILSIFPLVVCVVGGGSTWGGAV